MLYIILGILLFGILIAIHEFGHFFTAKLFGVRVNEFSIGMGPALFKRTRGETLYSLRLFPVGGYCAMEGEDEDSDDPRAFSNVAGWKKFIILCAGAFMNFVLGLAMILLLYAPAHGFYVETYQGSMDGYGTENCGLMTGDRFLSVDGHKVLVGGNASFYLSRAGETLDFVVERDGETVRLDNVFLPFQERTDAEGNTTNYRGITIGREIVPATVLNKLEMAWNTGIDFVRLVWISLGDLISGTVGLRDLSGPVGIVNAMNQVGEQSPTVQIALENLVFLGALIAVNLAVMNLLPLPALDGGRIFFLLLNGLFFLFARRKLDPKYEAFIHMTGMAALLLLMLLVTLSDIGKLFGQ